MKFFKKTDILIISIIILFCIISWIIYNLLASGKPVKAEIYYKSDLVKIIDLNSNIDKTFSIPQNEHVVFHLYKDGSIRFEESDCPDKVCIHAGKLNMVGETAACLPNEIILKIVPQNNYNENDPDIIIG